MLDRPPDTASPDLQEAIQAAVRAAASTPTVFDGTWWESVHKFLVANAIADYIGLLGIAGLGFTLWTALRTKSIAIVARDAAEDARDSVKVSYAIADAALALAALEEIRRLQNLGQWVILPDRYAELRRILQSIRAHRLSEHDQTTIQDAVVTLRSLEELVVENTRNDSELTNPKKLHRLVMNVRRQRL